MSSEADLGPLQGLFDKYYQLEAVILLSQMAPF